MNKPIRHIFSALSLLLLGLLLGFNVENWFVANSQQDAGKGLKKLEQAIAFIEKNYVSEPQHDELIDNAIKGMLDNLDPHSFYINAAEMKLREEEMAGSFEGIGVEYAVMEDTLYVVAPVVGGPSDRAGIKAGDKIVRVEDESVVGTKLSTTYIASKLKGTKGSKVKVSVKRAGIERLLEFTLTRDKIPLYSVDYSYMLTPEIGYLKITHFAENTYEEFIQHLRRLKSEGMENLILDLRGNPGGYLIMAKNIADEFLVAGKKIVATSGRIAETKQEYYATAALNEFEKGGLVILVDYGSASASEIVAGAVQDHDRGLIVGVRSYGKGLVQIQKKFEDGSAMRIVVSEYYTPSGRCIQKPFNKSHASYEHEIEERFESGELFDPNKAVFPDSLKYKTASGRTVYGGGGIFPDVFVPSDTSTNSAYLTQLYNLDLFRHFAYTYVDRTPSLSVQYPHAARYVYEFKPDSDLLKKFVKFADSQGVVFMEKDYETSLQTIRSELKVYIGKRLFQHDGYYPSLHESDAPVLKAVELMPQAVELQKSGRFTQR